MISVYNTLVSSLASPRNMAAFVSIVALSAGCNSPTGPTPPVPPPPARAVVSVTVSGPTSLTVGFGADYAAQASNSDGSAMNINQMATWSSSNPAILTVGSSGTVTARAGGRATITAAYANRSGSMDVLVTVPSIPPPPGSAANIAATWDVTIAPSPQCNIGLRRYRIQFGQRGSLAQGNLATQTLGAIMGSGSSLQATVSGNAVQLPISFTEIEGRTTYSVTGTIAATVASDGNGISGTLSGAWQVNRNPTCSSTTHQIVFSRVAGLPPGPPPA